MFEEYKIWETDLNTQQLLGHDKSEEIFMSWEEEICWNIQTSEMMRTVLCRPQRSRKLSAPIWWDALLAWNISLQPEMSSYLVSYHGYHKVRDGIFLLIIFAKLISRSQMLTLLMTLSYVLALQTDSTDKTNPGNYWNYLQI